MSVATDGKDGNGLKLEKVGYAWLCLQKITQKIIIYRYCSLIRIVLDLLHNSTNAFFVDNTNKVMFHYRIDLNSNVLTIFPL